jgi:hypothetical protein
MEEKSERLDLRAEKRVGVVDSGRKCRRARLIYTGLPKGHDSTATHLSLKCVRECVRGGSPLVILTNDGQLYFPISDKMPDTDQRQELMPFVGKYVRASGTVFERTGTHAIVITEIKEMKKIHLMIDGQ